MGFGVSGASAIIFLGLLIGGVTLYAAVDATAEQLDEAHDSNQERLLDRTNSTEEARRVRADLSEVRAQIRELEQRRTSIEQRESLSTVRLSIHEPPGKRPPKNYRAAFGFDDAFLDAFYGGLNVVKWVIVLFGYAIPVAVAGLLLAALGFVFLRAWLLLKANLDRLLPEAEAAPSSGDSDD